MFHLAEQVVQRGVQGPVHRSFVVVFAASRYFADRFAETAVALQETAVTRVFQQRVHSGGVDVVEIEGSTGVDIDGDLQFQVEIRGSLPDNPSKGLSG